MKNKQQTDKAASVVRQVEKIVAPSPAPTERDGQGFFRWAVRKGLVNQQAPGEIANYPQPRRK